MTDTALREISQLLHQRSKGLIADWDIKPAAVLVPLFWKDGEYHLLFTKRTAHLRQHPGQISFPGGRRDPEDVDLLATALRETEEEIGLDRQAVQILGELDDMMTSTQYRITPFVGVIPHPYQYQVNTLEIDRLLEVPLACFKDPTRIEVRYREFMRERIPVYYYNIGEDTVWGATARIVRNFLEAIAPVLPSFTNQQ
jgi:8-oxo-dGTP pyrophosphatase MutT (NUDIX family)